jgi:hypothetical protein
MPPKPKKCVFIEPIQWRNRSENRSETTIGAKLRKSPREWHEIIACIAKYQFRYFIDFNVVKLATSRKVQIW